MFRRIALAAAIFFGLLAGAFAQAPPPVPALPDTERRTAYSSGAGVMGNCSCAVGFALYGDGTNVGEWIEVWLNGINVPSTDPVNGWRLTSPTGPLGSIPRPITDAILTFNNSLTGPAVVQIVGARVPNRISQFPENRGVTARDLNVALTDIVAQNRESWDHSNDVTGRTLRTLPGFNLSSLPTPAICANKVVGFDATGLNPTCVPPGGGGGGGGGGTLTSITNADGSLIFTNPTGPAVVGSINTAHNFTWTGTNVFTASLAFSGLSSITQVKCLGLDVSNNVGWSSGACGTGGGGGITGPGSTTVNDIAAWGNTTGTSLTDMSWTTATSLLNTFTSTLKGLVPPPGGSGGTTNFLRADGTWQVPPSSGGIIFGTTGISGVPTPIVGNCLTVGTGPVVTQATCASGGAGIAITRAQIPTTNLSAGGGVPGLILVGFNVVNDAGSGAPYSCNGQSAASIGAIQDSVGTWCGIDYQRANAMGGFQPGWFGGDPNGSVASGDAMQAAIDAGFATPINTGVATAGAPGPMGGTNMTYCPAGQWKMDHPIFDDPPINIRGIGLVGGGFATVPGGYQTTWGPAATGAITWQGPRIIKPSTVTGIGTAKFTGSISGTTLTVASTQAGAVAIGEVLTDLSGAITSGTIITGNLTATTWTVTPSQTVASEAMIGSAYYVNNDPYWPALGEPPSRPNFSGNAFDFAYSVSSSLSPVAYHPTFTPFNGNNTNTTFLIEASFKSSGTIGTPQVVGGTQGGAFGAGFNFVGPDASGQDGPMRTKVTVPAASLIVVAILFAQGAVGTDVTSVTDSAGHTYTKAISQPSLGQPPLFTTWTSPGTGTGIGFWYSSNIATALPGPVAFTGSINNTALTVSSVQSGALAINQIIHGPCAPCTNGVLPLGTKIVSGSGTSWTISPGLGSGVTSPVAALTGAGEITVNAAGGLYVGLVTSVTGANGGVDKTTIGPGTQTGNTPSVSITPSVTSSIVFGAIVGDSGTGLSDITSMPWNYAESAGFTTLSPPVWIPANWDPHRTYAAGDVAYAGGIPWQSLQGSNTNNNPLSDLKANATAVWWIPTGNGASYFDQNVLFYGPPVRSGGSVKTATCVLQFPYNNSNAFVMSPGQGVTLANVSIQGSTPTNAVNDCALPISGLGLALTGGGGGSNRGKITHVAVGNFFAGIALGIANFNNSVVPAGGLGAENALDNLVIASACYGLIVQGTQTDANILSDSTFDVNTAVYMPNEVGLIIHGGNFSKEGVFGDSPAQKFAMTVTTPAASINDGISLSFTATLNTNCTATGDNGCTSGPSPYLTPGVTCTDPGTGASMSTIYSLTNLCIQNEYNAWTLDARSAGYGIIPLALVAWTPGAPGTGTAKFRVLNEWLQAIGLLGTQGTAADNALLSAIAAQTQIYAMIYSRLFAGTGMTIDNAFIESAPNPWMLTDSSWVFGDNRTTIIKNLKINSDPTGSEDQPPAYVIGLGGPACAQNQVSPPCGSDSADARILAQQSFSWIRTGGGNVLLDNICCNARFDSMMVDLSSSPTVGGHNLEIRGGSFNGPLAFRFPTPTTVGGGSANNGSGGTFTGSYMQNGSAGFGAGLYETNPWLQGPMGFTGDIIQGRGQAGPAMTQGWNSGPYYGVRPAPWTAPCVSLSQYAALNNLPPIGFNLNQNIADGWDVYYPILWSGQQYKICDWTLSSSPWSNSITYPANALVAQSGNTYISTVNNNFGNTPGTPQTFTGSISPTTCGSQVAWYGCLTVSAVTGTILPGAPITGGGTLPGTRIVFQVTGTTGGTGTYSVDRPQTVASSTLSATYWTLNSPHYGFVSNHGVGFSFGQNITTTVMAGLNWNIHNNSPFVNIASTNGLGLLFPGLNIGLAGTQTGCTTQENFIIRGVHSALRYVDVLATDQDFGGTLIPNFAGTPALCSNTVINQASYLFAPLN